MIIVSVVVWIQPYSRCWLEMHANDQKQSTVYIWLVDHNDVNRLITLVYLVTLTSHFNTITIILQPEHEKSTYVELECYLSLMG